MMSEQEQSAFQKNLRKLIEEQGMTIQEFGDMTGISRASISGYLIGTRQPTLNCLLMICKATSTSADWLLGIEGKE